VRVWPEMGASLRWGDLCERVGAGTLQEKNAGVKPLCRRSSEVSVKETKERRRSLPLTMS